MVVGSWLKQWRVCTISQVINVETRHTWHTDHGTRGPGDFATNDTSYLRAVWQCNNSRIATSYISTINVPGHYQAHGSRLRSRGFQHFHRDPWHAPHSTLTSTGCSEKLSTKTKHIPALFGARQVNSTKKSNCFRDRHFCLYFGPGLYLDQAHNQA